jgi:hypothetical protein
VLITFQLLHHPRRVHGIKPVSLEARELDFVNALDLSRVPSGMQHDIGSERLGLVVGEDGAVDLGVPLVARLDGRIAAFSTTGPSRVAAGARNSPVLGLMGVAQAAPQDWSNRERPPMRGPPQEDWNWLRGVQEAVAQERQRSAAADTASRSGVEDTVLGSRWCSERAS